MIERITNMVPEIATILIGTCVGAVAVVYAGTKGYLGHRKSRAAPSPATTTSAIATATEQANEVPAAETRVAAEPAPSPSPAPSSARYETVQPAPRDGPARPSPSHLLGSITDFRSSNAREEADKDIQASDGPCTWSPRCQEGPHQTQEAVGRRNKARAWVHKPTLHLF
jgi:hypothetical protein